MATGPDGHTMNPNLAPDGQPFDEADSPYGWSQSSRERGSYRRDPNGRPYRSVVAIGNHDGSQVGASQEDLLWDILLELRAMRLGMMATKLIEEVKDVRDLR